MVDAADSRLAKRLARVVLEAGESRIAELGPALERVLDGRSAAARRRFLKVFHQAVVRELHRVTLAIESAAELPDALVDQLVEDFSRGRSRPLQVVRRTNPDLIAGIRVRFGDTVTDATVASRLQSLMASTR
jgi:F0F1-type ATP synthase delta subunit